jgi:hypothetical protein
MANQTITELQNRLAKIRSLVAELDTMITAAESLPLSLLACDDYEIENDGQPDEYTEWQDFMGGDDWDQGQYDTDCDSMCDY